MAAEVRAGENGARSRHPRREKAVFSYETASGPTVFLNRDPIEEQGGLNLYGFVGNDPVNVWDYLGLDFIAVTSRPLTALDRRGLRGTFGHYAIGYFEGCCDAIEVGQEYTVDEVFELCPGLEYSESTELLRSTGWRADVRHWLRGARTIDVNVSYIAYDRVDGTDLIPVFYDNNASVVREKWNEVINLSENYEYAEQEGFDQGTFGVFRNWPNSRYYNYNPANRINNNSNVFVRFIVNEAGMPWYSISARGHPPGYSSPLPVDDHDYMGIPYR